MRFYLKNEGEDSWTIRDRWNSDSLVGSIYRDPGNGWSYRISPAVPSPSVGAAMDSGFPTPQHAFIAAYAII